MHCAYFIGWLSEIPKVQLLRMKLENWRGVAQREVEFSAGVTVIEGPNEVGKSTIVEALQVLFTDLDGARSKRVQAIAPIGQDVGSTVELQFAVGECRLVFSKTYNKNRATQLSVTGAQTLQLAGREAHEWVVEFLAERVDMDLWRALLVDQSDTLGKANLQSSQGLARALDEAAGNSSDNGREAGPIEDTNLYAAALAEYEKYFTLKTGKPRAAVVQLEKRTADAEQTLAQAQAALQTVAEDTVEQERHAAEVLRLRAELPRLQAQAQAHELAWTELSSMQEQRQAKRQELAAAQTLLQGLQQAQDARQLLVQEIESEVKRLAGERELGAPLQQQTQALKRQMELIRKRLGTLRTQLEQARANVGLAVADADYYQNLERLEQGQQSLKQLQDLARQMSAHLEITKGSNIGDKAVEELRAAETALAIVEGQRDTAATTFEILAHADLSASISGRDVEIRAGQQAKGPVSEKLVLELPGMAQITLTPSTSVADIQDTLIAAQAQLEQLRQTYAVVDSGAAQKINVLRSQAQVSLDKLADQQQQLLRGKNLVELEHEASALDTAVQRYLAQRSDAAVLPANLSQANAELEQARQVQAELEAEQERQQRLEEEQHKEYEVVDGRYREVQQNLQGLRATLSEKQNRLAKDRAVDSDEALQATAAAQLLVVTQVAKLAEELDSAWQVANPDAVNELRDNSRMVCSRATDNLAENQRRLDTLNDLLQRAQADGRFEAADNAANTHEHCLTELQSMQNRAAAAQRLWNGLSEHRNLSRQAYVEPLKRAIEALGSIVFGSDFSIELDEDWTLVSRTLGGQTLPFESLSIGAKEQLGILLRLAAGQVTAAQGGVPLIIDDALGFSDPTRLSTMGAAIAAAGRQAQVIILTCTPGRFTHVGNAKVVALD